MLTIKDEIQKYENEITGHTVHKMDPP